MAQYIDKATVVAEIEKRMKKYATIDVGNSSELEALYGAKCKALMEILSFLNTLEVKEVDLDEEIENWVKIGPHTSYPWCTIPDAIRITAEHFFELGINAEEDKL